MKLDNISTLIDKISRSLGSIIKIALMSGGASAGSDEGKGKELVIMGNGPSLRQTIDKDYEWLVSHDLMAVNFAALSEDFFRLRPKFYLIADGHFFNAVTHDRNVKKLWETFEKISWPITLILPSKFRHLVKPLLLHTHDIKTRFFNLTPVEGFRNLSHFFFSMGWGMPRPRNVMIPAIMEGIRLGYERIYLCGADHTWTKTLDVDDENFVVSIQPHFYEDNEEEHRRVRETYKGLRLHDVLGSMTIAFRSYWDVAVYAKKRKVEIINATPGSMIDAFPRMNHDYSIEKND